MRRWQATLSLLLLNAGQVSALADNATAIHAGHLLTPSNQFVQQRTIVVVDDRIAEIHAGFLQASDLAEYYAVVDIVDLSEAYVLPGLIDGHVHLADSPDSHVDAGGVALTEGDLTLVAAEHARVALRAGFTTVVDLGAVGISGHENAIFAVRDAVAAGTLDGSRVIAAGTPVAASGLERASHYRSDVSQAIDYRSVCDGASDCRRAVRHQVKRGSDIIVFFNTGSLLAVAPIAQSMTVQEMTAIVETAHALGRKVIADGHHAAGISAAIEAGADIIDSAHLYDQNTFDEFTNTTFLQSHIFGVIQAVGDSHETLHDGLWGWLPTSILLRFQAIRQRQFAMIAAYESGINNLAYASDAGVYRWGDNAGDLLEFVRRGMSPQDAIATATVNAARMLGRDGEIGSIAVGKKADIIAVSGDPIENIASLLQVAFVMRDGKIFKRSTSKLRTATMAAKEYLP